MYSQRNNVQDSRDGKDGAERQAIVFVHGFGCDQSMWRDVLPALAGTYRLITYDLTGMGQSDLSQYDPARYATLAAHAEDLLGICAELDLRDAIVVGHSVGASIAVMAANAAPDRIARLALICPSPSFLDGGDDGYDGGFAQEDLAGLVAFLDENPLAWAGQMAPTIAGQDADAPGAQTLEQSFCRADPDILRHFGHVTFFADTRADFAALAQPALIIQCAVDALVPLPVSAWMRDRMASARLHVLDATGHCPHMTVPDKVAAVLVPYLAKDSHHA